MMHFLSVSRGVFYLDRSAERLKQPLERSEESAIQGAAGLPRPLSFAFETIDWAQAGAVAGRLITLDR